eukprot:3149838-Amphidinium_carterae.1
MTCKPPEHDTLGKAAAFPALHTHDILRGIQQYYNLSQRTTCIPEVSKSEHHSKQYIQYSRDQGDKHITEGEQGRISGTYKIYQNADKTTESCAKDRRSPGLSGNSRRNCERKLNCPCSLDIEDFCLLQDWHGTSCVRPNLHVMCQRVRSAHYVLCVVQHVHIGLHVASVMHFLEVSKVTAATIPAFTL